MKATSNKFALLTSDTLEKLTKEVKETLAPVIVLSQQKTFCSVDLWNIQRQVRHRGQRRFL